MRRPECAQDGDCARGFVCEAGACRCTADESCAVNQACLSGQCGDRPRCAKDADCATYGRRCESTQGVCVPPCVQAADCAPGVDPNVATLLYVCQQGTCGTRCVNDATCGNGASCVNGVCQQATCATLADCPAGQYCTSATTGHCVAYQTCASAAECPANNACAAFAPNACPPGFPCAQQICRELPRCLVDGDCAQVSGAPLAFCQAQHCQPTTACADDTACAPGRLCVAGTCVPGGCRGPADCPSGQACVAGRCASPPAASSLAAVSLSPKTAVLAVGESLRLFLIGYTLDGSSFPLPSASFTVLAPDGSVSTAATLDASGQLTAKAAGRVRVRAAVPGSSVAPDEATVTLVDVPASGRRVVVIDAATRRPLVGVAVRGCDAPPADGPCFAPVDVTTDANGQADFAFTGATATFTAASPELRADGRPRYDAVSAIATGATTVLLPLTDNPVHAAAGFTAAINFRNVPSAGNLWLGFAALSEGDPSVQDPQAILGETFNATIPQLNQRVALPGASVAYLALAGTPVPLKGTAYGLGPAGRRAAVGFAGKFDPTQLNVLGTADLLSYAGAMDYALSPFTQIPLLPEVADTTDLNGNGRCSDPAKCPAGPEDLPDYLHFPQLSFTPAREQQRRTEVVLPALPSGLDTAIVSAVEGTAESGLVPLGFASSAGGLPNPDGSRPVAPVVLRSGAPYGGLEVGLPGVWATAAALGAGVPGTGNVSARLARSGSLPTRVVLPPFLPVPTGSSYDPSTRVFSPGQPGWNALASAGANVARLVLGGTDSRRVVYFALSGNQSSLYIPELPADVGPDAAATAATLDVTGLQLQSGMALDGLLDVQGSNLQHLSVLLEGYSRSRVP